MIKKQTNKQTNKTYENRSNTITNLIKTSKNGPHKKKKNSTKKKKKEEARHGVEGVSMLFFGLKKKSTVIF